jgi:hypothetical protein
MKKKNVALVIDSRFLRCDACFVSRGVYGQPDIGTPMITEIVRIERGPGVPNEDIAKVTRCGRAGCSKRAVVVPFVSFPGHGITLASLEALVRQQSGTLTFTPEELKSGTIKRSPLPASIEAFMQVQAKRPTFGRDYDPNAHIEPAEQREFPL